MHIYTSSDKNYLSLDHIVHNNNYLSQNLFQKFDCIKVINALVLFEDLCCTFGNRLLGIQNNSATKKQKTISVIHVCTRQSQLGVILRFYDNWITRAFKRSLYMTINTVVWKTRDMEKKPFQFHFNVRSRNYTTLEN